MPPQAKTETAFPPSSLFSSLEKRTPILCLLLALATLAIYNPVTRHPFVNYDDDRYVTENPHLHEGLTVASVKWAITSTEQANWHPLTWMSHALDVSLFRMNPSGHHFTSVLIHTMNVVLLFLLLLWATERVGASLFVAALFALHPLQVESVAWVAERKNVLCTLFFFLAIWSYGWYAQRPSWKRYTVVLAMFIAALASKPMVITLPFVLLLLDYWPLRRDRKWPNLFLEKVPLFVLSGASAVLTMYAQRTGGAVRTIEEFSFGARAGNAIDSYAMYLWQMVWPLRLAPLYPHPGNLLPAWRVLLAAAVLCAISFMVFKFRQRRYLLVGWLWFLGTLVPVIGLVQVGEAARADRYTYIPLIGIFVMIGFGAADWLAQQRWKKPALVPAIIILGALAFLTHRQIGYWQSNYALWSHTLQVTDSNFVAEDNLGGALILEGKEEDAHPHFEEAARINPHDPMSRSNLGTYAQTHNHLPEAIAQYQQVIEMTTDPTLLAQTYANMGAAQRSLDESDKAQKSFEQSLRFNANQFNAWLGLGLLAQSQGRIGDAITDLSRSVDLQPTAEAYFQLGRMLTQTGHVPEAIDAYENVLKLSPGLAEAQQALDALRQR